MLDIKGQKWVATHPNGIFNGGGYS